MYSAAVFRTRQPCRLSLLSSLRPSIRHDIAEPVGWLPWPLLRSYAAYAVPGMISDAVASLGMSRSRAEAWLRTAESTWQVVMKAYTFCLTDATRGKMRLV